MDDIVSKDLYELIGVQTTSSVQEIKKAYRKKALQCHPDKNRDNPRAAELFLELSKALEILTDKSARAAYDKVFSARQQAKLRIKELDATRKKFKEDLEARENAHLRSLNSDYNAKDDKRKLEAEIERLRKEGSRQVEEEVAYVKNKIYEQLHAQGEVNKLPSNNRIKLKWRVDKNDLKNGGYNYDILHRILLKYGEITALIISSTKKGSALVEFEDRKAAETAAQIEVGLVENPLMLKPLWDMKRSGNNEQNKKYSTDQTGLSTRLFPIQKMEQETNDKPHVMASFSSAPNIFLQQTDKMSDSEFENSVLSNLRRAEEQKRLLEQLRNNDDNDDDDEEEEEEGT